MIALGRKISPWAPPTFALAGARCVEGSKMNASWSISAAAIVIGIALPASADDLATRLGGHWLCYSSPSEREFYGVNGVFIVVGEAGLPRAGRWSVSGSERTIVFKDGAHQIDQMTFTSEKEIHRVSKGGVLGDGSPYVEGLASDADRAPWRGVARRASPLSGLAGMFILPRRTG
jgi:hypothetical protein